MESDWFDDVAGTRFDTIEWVAEIGSTNTELLERAKAGAGEGLVKIADLQTAGRGRRGRSWTAPPGTALMMSVLLRPPPGSIQPSQASFVTTAWALSAIEAVESACGLALGLKWPNDLVVPSPVAPDDRGPGDPGYRKVAGILTESVLAGAEIEALVVGMGLNTGWPEVPPELAQVAASINLIAGRTLDRPALASSILTHFEVRYSRLVSEGPRSLLPELRSRSETLGQVVRVELGNGDTVTGTARDVDLDGRLVVEDDRGTHHLVAVGDLVHLRPRVT